MKPALAATAGVPHPGEAAQGEGEERLLPPSSSWTPPVSKTRTSAVPPADEPRAGQPGVPTSRFVVGDHVDILAGRGEERTWRPGVLTKVTRARATVRYRAARGQSEVRQTVPFHRVRRRTA